MTTVAVPPEQRVVLRGVTWETYERLLADRGEAASPRLTFDRGVLEIMSPAKPHEALASLVGLLVGGLSEAWDVDVMPLGHLTFRKEEWERGFEPDDCFWVGAVAAAIRLRDEVVPGVDPPPDVVVEVDITSSSIDKLALFARFGIPEVWRHDGERATILVLRDDGYREVGASRAFPRLTADALTHLLQEGRRTPLPRWLAAVRRWATA